MLRFLAIGSMAVVVVALWLAALGLINDGLGAIAVVAGLAATFGFSCLERGGDE